MKARSGTQEFVVPGQTGAPMALSAKAEREADGKWKKVDVGYIAHRTAEPERLPGGQGRRDSASNLEVQAPSAKDADGKWKAVDTTTYINARTGECDRLEGAKTRNSLSAIPSETSATVKKMVSGSRWTQRRT